jgi:hypothetical protein
MDNQVKVKAIKIFNNITKFAHEGTNLVIEGINLEKQNDPYFLIWELFDAFDPLNPFIGLQYLIPFEYKGIKLIRRDLIFSINKVFGQYIQHYLENHQLTVGEYLNTKGQIVEVNCKDFPCQSTLKKYQNPYNNGEIEGHLLDNLTGVCLQYKSGNVLNISKKDAATIVSFLSDLSEINGRKSIFSTK